MNGPRVSILLLLLFAIYIASGFLREVVYLLLPLYSGLAMLHLAAGSAGSAVGQGRRNPLSTATHFTILFSVITLATFGFSWHNGAFERGLKEILFSVGSLISAFSLTWLALQRVDAAEWIESLTRHLAVFSLLMVVYEGAKFAWQGLPGGSFSLVEVLVFSKSETEHAVTPNLGFVFGAVALFMAVRKRWLWMLPPLVLVLLSGKRIVMLGVVGAAGWGLAMTVFAPRFQWVRRGQHVVIPGVSILALVLVLQFATGGFDVLIEKWTGLNPNLLSMGRRALYEIAVRQGVWTIFPSGIGHTFNVLAPYVPITGSTLLHSDLLKIYIEYGLLLATALLGAFWLLCRGSIAVTVLMIYFLVLFATDNVSIYFDVVVFVFMMVFALSAAEQNEGYSRQNRAKPLPGALATRWRRYRLIPL